MDSFRQTPRQRILVIYTAEWMLLEERYRLQRSVVLEIPNLEYLADASPVAKLGLVDVERRFPRPVIKAPFAVLGKEELALIHIDQIIPF